MEQHSTHGSCEIRTLFVSLPNLVLTDIVRQTHCTMKRADILDVFADV